MSQTSSPSSCFYVRSVSSSEIVPTFELLPTSDQLQVSGLTAAY